MDVKQRTIEFLQGELDALRAQLDEVNMLLDLLDAPPLPSDDRLLTKKEAANHAGVSVKTIDKALLGQAKETTSRAGRKAVDLGNENRRKIVFALERNGGCTTQHLMESLNLPHSTVKGQLDKLLETGRVTRTLGKTHKGGRAPFIYKLVPGEQREHHLDLESRLVLD